MCTSSYGSKCSKSSHSGCSLGGGQSQDVKYLGLNLLALAQVIYFLVIVEIHGYAPFGIYNVKVEANVSSLASVTGYITTEVTQPVNVYLGPTEEGLVKASAAFTPCMRNDHEIFTRYKILEQVRKDGLCCGRCTVTNNLTGIQYCTYTDRARCLSLYRSKETSFAFSSTCRNVDAANGRLVVNNFAACCVGLLGHCKMTTVTECLHTLKGSWFENQLCEEVNCLSEKCGGVQKLRADTNYPHLPASANQVYRWLSAAFLHRGVIEIFCLLNIQYWLGRPIELDNGVPAVIIVFLISGIGGHMVATTLQPYKVHTGSRCATWGYAAYYPLTFLRDWEPSSAPMVKLLNHLCFFAFMLALDALLQTSPVGNIAGFSFGLWTLLLLQRTRWLQRPAEAKPFWMQKEYWLRLHAAVFAVLALVITVVCFYSQVRIPFFLSGYQPQYCGKGVRPLTNPAALVLYDEHEFDFIVTHTNHTMAMLSSSCSSI